MRAIERRQLILEALSDRRQETSLINSGLATGSASYLDFTTDSSGNALALKDFTIFIGTLAKSTSGTPQNLSVSIKAPGGSFVNVFTITAGNGANAVNMRIHIHKELFWVGEAVVGASYDDNASIVFGSLAKNAASSMGRSNDEAVRKNGTVKLNPEDVLHVPGLGFDGLVGYSPIAMAKNAIGLAIATEEFGAKFFANGAAPSGVLEHPGTIKDPAKVRESWNTTFGGSGNAGKVAVLEEGMKYTPISISPEQAQFLETRKFQINEIARIFRVPPHMVGDLEKSSFSNIEQQSLEFVKYTLDPWVIRWEQAMARAWFTDDEKKTLFIKFSVDGLLRGDYASRMSGYATARQNGWMSANDIRELENLDKIPSEDGGDLYLINGNMLPMGNAGAFANKYIEKKEEEETDDTQDEEVLDVEKSDGRRRLTRESA